MPGKELPARPNLEQYKKQAKDLLRDFKLGLPDAVQRFVLHHPDFQKMAEPAASNQIIKLTDAQLVIAREYGCVSWPHFASHIAAQIVARSIDSLPDPVAAFIEAACVPRDASHASGTLDESQAILSRYPYIARDNIYAAAIIANETSVRGLLADDPKSATATGGPRGWDALTYLCFSRYLRIAQERTEQFVNTARALLDAGASANTGWYETIDQPNPRQIIESAIYGAAGVAQNAELTRLLLEYGADPNDEETPYHVAEGYDLAVLKILVESGRLNGESLTTLLLRKADWHDTEGIRLLLAHGADPNAMTRWGFTALQQAVRRDNRLENIALLLDHGADPTLKIAHNETTATLMAVRRGRGDVLALLAERGIDPKLEGVDRLIAACASADEATIRVMASQDPHLMKELVAEGGTLLGAFAGNGNAEGVRCLLDLGIHAGAISREGDAYFDVARYSTALHAAAWRGWPATVKMLIERGAPVNALDGKGRTALALAVRACVDSYWKDRRTPDSVEALLKAGATVAGIQIPCGYDEVDALLMQYAKRSER
jgi:ankyrin repeat protein